MSNSPLYNIRDKSGNIYGPADAPTLIQWTQQGRIIAGMAIAPDGTTDWLEASRHPAVSHLFGYSAPQPTYNSPTPAPASESTNLYSPTYQTAPGYEGGPPSLNILSLLSMIFGILSLPTFFCCCIGPFSAIVSVILGLIALVQISKSPNRYTGKALAITGLITSALGLLAFLGLMLFGFLNQH